MKREARSTSAPPGFAESTPKKPAVGALGAEGTSGNSQGYAGTGQSPLGAWPQSGTASSRALQKEMQVQTSDNPDDFVSGGIELPPDPEKDAPERLPHGDEDSQAYPTQPLPLLQDPQLEEFWPAGDGPRALFLDYDGTLREFEARPELATPTEEIMKLLHAINARQDYVPHIISGRDAKFLEASFGSLNRFTLIAEHGFQIWRAGGTEGWTIWDHPDGLDKEHEDWKVIVREHLTSFVNATPGSHVEEKASSLVWHYREVADQAKAEAAAVAYMDKLESIRDTHDLQKIRMSHGHKVVEVSYRKVRKGPVMRRICEEKGIHGVPFLSVFVAGDDTSDESMFDIAPHDFLTVKVGPAKTHAKFRVDSPVELRAFLWQLVS